MPPFTFKCRAVDIKHSCNHKNASEPKHPYKLLRFIEDVTTITEQMGFMGIIKSPSNSYQIAYDFDDRWIETINNLNWTKSIGTLQAIEDIPNIGPDAILNKEDTTITVEIEKSNQKTIWFDFMKLILLIGRQVADYGVLVVPRNYAHKNGVWDLFTVARYYRYCLEHFAKVDKQLLSKIAIIGYTQETYLLNEWQLLDTSVINNIKEKARRVL